nr:hypothetical protein IGGMDNGE_00270 [Pseudomonas aeruginosa]
MAIASSEVAGLAYADMKLSSKERSIPPVPSLRITDMRQNCSKGTESTKVDPSVKTVFQRV